VPRNLAHGDVRARAITRDDLHEDVAGINASLDLIRRTRGGKWPTGPVTEDGNYADLVWHEVEFRDGSSYTYTLRDAADGYLGCLYLYPMGGRTPLTEELLAHDVDVSWWVTTEAYEAGWYPKAHTAVRAWLAEDLPFNAPFFSNRELPAS
jgi:hypothetical protein